MEIAIDFTCNCGYEVTDSVVVEIDTDPLTGNRSHYRFYENFHCRGCSRDYPAEIYVDERGPMAEIPLAHNIYCEAIVDEDESQYVYIESSHSEQLEFFQLNNVNIKKILDIEYPEELQLTMYSMLYAQVVTSIEAYLSSSFISTVLPSKDLMLKTIATDKSLADRKFDLKDAFTIQEKVESIVAEHLQNVIFHNIEKVKPMYRDVLDIEIGSSLRWLFKAVTIRHDCVHRCGKTKEGITNQITKGDVEQLIRNAVKFVAHIEAELDAKHTLVTGFKDSIQH